MDIPSSLKGKIQLTPAQARAQSIWLIVVQVVALGLMALALAWVRKPPVAAYRCLLLLLALGSLIIALRSDWRRGIVAGVLGSLTLAFTCSLSATHTLPEISGLDPLISGYIPNMALTIALAALLLAIWGVVVRGGLADQGYLGVAALVGAVMIGVFAVAYLMIFVYGVRMLNVVENWQFAELAAVTVLYSLALWIGGLGIRSTSRLSIVPAGTVVILAAFLIHWQMMHHQVIH